MHARYDVVGGQRASGVKAVWVVEIINQAKQRHISCSGDDMATTIRSRRLFMQALETF